MDSFRATTRLKRVKNQQEGEEEDEGQDIGVNQTKGNNKQGPSLQWFQGMTNKGLWVAVPCKAQGFLEIYYSSESVIQGIECKFQLSTLFL